ncbi:MAG: 4Fe-4S dicluster domain-containing protein [Eubacteriales bacterium]|nr:4Fe-4S dicluster domain-containing protein [Eubacteriales bacterium]
MRGLDTPVREIRKSVFREVAKFAYEQKDLHTIEDLPYEIIPGEMAKYRDSIYRERAIVGERIRLAMGMSLRPADQPARITKGIDESNISEKYYEPPLLQVIPSACNACKDRAFIVGAECQGCMAHPCKEVCPKGAISFVDGYSHIDQEKCIKCGQCSKVCPYSAIYERRRPCEVACGVGAIGTDYAGRAVIDPDKCVSCGMCMVSCPFGAIADKSQIYQLIKSMNEGNEVVAILAPAFVGQFGPKATPAKIKAALLEIGFADVWEVAVGADAGALEEAEHYATKVATGELPFLLTSCCPSWSMLGKKYFPEVIDEISNALTPMVATARAVRVAQPKAKIVFVGPCVAKKLEASRRTVRSEVDFVITFEELDAMFEAKEINFNTYDKEVDMNDAFGAGRGYAVAGGVSAAIEACVKEYYPDVEMKIDHVEGLAECKKMLLQAKNGKKNGFLIEGMGCPGGCVAGAGTNIPVNKAGAQVRKFANDAVSYVPPETAKY